MSEMKTIIKEKNAEVKNDKTRIVVKDHPAFTGGLKTDLTSSIALAETIGMMLSEVMDDYYGCRIRVNDGNYEPASSISNVVPRGAMYVEIYLKDSGRTKSVHKNLISNLHADANGEKATMSDRFKSVTGSKTSRAYTVTDETYEMLEEFMFPNVPHRWFNLTSEIYTVVNQPHGSAEVLTVITGLSLDALITKIYGDRTDEGQFEYMATPSTRIPYKNNEFVIQVTQLNKKTVRDLEATLGVYTANTGIHTYNR